MNEVIEQSKKQIPTKLPLVTKKDIESQYQAIKLSVEELMNTPKPRQHNNFMGNPFGGFESPRYQQ